MLSELDDLISEVTPHLRSTVPRAPLALGNGPTNFISDFRCPPAWVSTDKLYCPVCAMNRFMRVNVLVHSGPLTRLARAKPRTSKQLIDPNEFGASLLVFTCEQCALKLNCLIYDEIVGTIRSAKLIVFPSKSGGLSTAHTPAEVEHFVDEAYKCQCVDAHGAAVEMYRVALEQLLHEQGYKAGMLKEKLDALEADRVGGTAKPWAADLDIDMMDVLRKLGNQVAHPKGAGALATFNRETLIGVQEVFQFLLADIYERPMEQEKLLASLHEKT